MVSGSGSLKMMERKDMFVRGSAILLPLIACLSHIVLSASAEVWCQRQSLSDCLDSRLKDIYPEGFSKIFNREQQNKALQPILGVHMTKLITTKYKNSRDRSYEATAAKEETNAAGEKKPEVMSWRDMPRPSKLILRATGKQLTSSMYVFKRGNARIEHPAIFGEHVPEQPELNCDVHGRAPTSSQLKQMRSHTWTNLRNDLIDSFVSKMNQKIFFVKVFQPSKVIKWLANASSSKPKAKVTFQAHDSVVHIVIHIETSEEETPLSIKLEKGLARVWV